MIANDINIPSAKIKYGLDRTFQFLELCNNPQKKISSIQIIGTNGKGTVAAMLSNILKDSYNINNLSRHDVDEENEISISSTSTDKGTYLLLPEVHIF